MSRPREFGPIQLARWLGLDNDQLRRALHRGLIPAPDIDGRRWSKDVAEALPERAAEVLDRIGDHPGLGSQKAAERVAERTGLPLTREDIADLADRGELSPVGDYMGSPLYSLDDLDSLTHERLQAAVTRRRTWIENSLTAQEAADLLGWPQGRFEVTAERRGLLPGRLDRYLRTDVERLQETDRPS